MKLLKTKEEIWEEIYDKVSNIIYEDDKKENHDGNNEKRF